jgi:hypothetical protein
MNPNESPHQEAAQNVEKVASFRHSDATGNVLHSLMLEEPRFP